MAHLAFIAGAVPSLRAGLVGSEKTSSTRTCPSCVEKGAVANIAAKTGTALLVAATAAAAFLSSTDPALAISGGGKDYASKDWTGVDFSHGDYSGKDFSGGLFRGCSFKGSNLRGARMFKSELREADMTGADLTGVSLEGAILRDTNLHNVILVNGYIGESIVDAKDISGADFTDALISPESAQTRLCNRPDATGVNPVTKVDTRESLICAP